MSLKYYLFNYPPFLNTNQFRVITENNIGNTTPYGLLLSGEKNTTPPENNC